MHSSEINKEQQIGEVQLHEMYGDRSSRKVYVPGLAEVDGGSRMVPCDPEHSESKELELTERQTRQLCDRLWAIVEAWDFVDDEFGK